MRPSFPRRGAPWVNGNRVSWHTSRPAAHSELSAKSYRQSVVQGCSNGVGRRDGVSLGLRIGAPCPARSTSWHASNRQRSEIPWSGFLRPGGMTRAPPVPAPPGGGARARSRPRYTEKDVYQKRERARARKKGACAPFSLHLGSYPSCSYSPPKAASSISTAAEQLPVMVSNRPWVTGNTVCMKKSAV